MSEIKKVLDHFENRKGNANDLRNEKEILEMLAELSYEERDKIFIKAHAKALESEDAWPSDIVVEMMKGHDISEFKKKEKKKDDDDDDELSDIQEESDDEDIKESDEESDEERPRRPKRRINLIRNVEYKSPKTKKSKGMFDRPQRHQKPRYYGGFDPEEEPQELNPEIRKKLGYKNIKILNEMKKREVVEELKKQKLEKIDPNKPIDKTDLFMSETTGIVPKGFVKGPFLGEYKFPTVNPNARLQFEMALPRVMTFKSTPAMPTERPNVKMIQPSTSENQIPDNVNALLNLNHVPSDFRQFMRAILFQNFYPRVGHHKIAGLDIPSQPFSSFLLTGLIPYHKSTLRKHTTESQVYYIVRWSFDHTSFRREFTNEADARLFTRESQSYLIKSFLSWDTNRRQALLKTPEHQKVLRELLELYYDRAGITSELFEEAKSHFLSQHEDELVETFRKKYPKKRAHTDIYDKARSMFLDSREKEIKQLVKKLYPGRPLWTREYLRIRDEFLRHYEADIMAQAQTIYQYQTITPAQFSKVRKLYAKEHHDEIVKHVLSVSPKDTIRSPEFIKVRRDYLKSKPKYLRDKTFNPEYDESKIRRDAMMKFVKAYAKEAGQTIYSSEFIKLRDDYVKKNIKLVKRIAITMRYEQPDAKETLDQITASYMEEFQKTEFNVDINHLTLDDIPKPLWNKFREAMGMLVDGAYKVAVQRYNYATRLEKIKANPSYALDQSLVSEAIGNIVDESILDEYFENRETYLRLLENQAKTLLREHHLSPELALLQDYKPSSVEENEAIGSLMRLVMEQILIVEEAAFIKSAEEINNPEQSPRFHRYLSELAKPLVFLMDSYSDVAVHSNYFKIQLENGNFQIIDAGSWTNIDYFPEFFLAVKDEEVLQRGEQALDKSEVHVHYELCRLYLSLIYPTKRIYSMQNYYHGFPWNKYIDTNIPGQCSALGSGYIIINGEKVPSSMEDIVIAQLENGQFRCYNIRQVQEAIDLARKEKRFPGKVIDPYQPEEYLPADFVLRIARVSLPITV